MLCTKLSKDTVRSYLRRSKAAKIENRPWRAWGVHVADGELLTLKRQDDVASRPTMLAIARRVVKSHSDDLRGVRMKLGTRL
jgi:hypothetical protein